MEEFNFESDLFGALPSTKSSEKVKPQFKPLFFCPADYKNCDELKPEFKADPKLFKQFADYLYFKGDLSEALRAYKEIEPLYRGNSFMTKCVLESEAWCLAKLGQPEEAAAIARSLLPEANTYESKHGLEFFLDTIKK
jgi:tetratricopeptide (TPR) repeat protein